MISKRFLWILTAFCLMFVLAACGEDDADEDMSDGDVDNNVDGDVDGDQEEINKEPFSFVVISDTHVRLAGKPDSADYEPEKNQSNFRDAVTRINDEYADAAFVAITGDLAGCLFSENTDDYGKGEANPAETFKEIADGLDMPYHAVLGNHDYQKSYDPEESEGVSTSDLSAIESVWKKVLGIDPYYSVVHNGVRMLFLNANRGDAFTIVCGGCKAEAGCTGSFDQEQLLWLEDELAKDEPVVIFLHHPLFTDDSKSVFSFLDSFLVEEDDPFYGLAETSKDKILGVFVGHGHIFERDTLFGSITVYETGSIGDSGGNKDNMHFVEVDPVKPEIKVTLAREGAKYGLK